MSADAFHHQQFLQVARFSPKDITKIRQSHRPHNRLGFAYQLAFVRVHNRFPAQDPLEIIEALLTYVSVQLSIPAHLIQTYQQRRPTLVEHRGAILAYLGLRRCGPTETENLEQFLFAQACRLEQTGPLMSQARQFLREAGILSPADSTLRRLIGKQRQLARQHLFERLLQSLSADQLEKLDALLTTSTNQVTPFQMLKQPPGKASFKAMLRLARKLDRIRETGIHTLNLSWLNNNYQRSLARYARRLSASRVRELQSRHRYAVLVCFLWQTYGDTIDHMIDMYHKLMLGVYKRAQTELDEQTRQQRRMIRNSLGTFYTLGEVILDENIHDSELRAALFAKISKDQLTTQMDTVEIWLTGKYSHVFYLVMQRFSYLRQFAPTLLENLAFQLEEGAQSTVSPRSTSCVN